MTESNNPVVSVVIPTYNRARMVGNAIQSVMAQTFGNWELLVIDDGSADDTRVVVSAFRDTRLSFHRLDRNRGQSAARNTGINLARGTYVSFLDSDDEWFPEKLAREVAAFEAGGEAVGLVYCGKELLGSDGRFLGQRLPTFEGDVYRRLQAGDFIGSCSRVALRKSVLEVVGGFDETLPSYEDWDLWLRAAKVSKVASVPVCLVRRHLSGAQISGSLQRIYDGRFRVVEKHRADFDATQLSQHLSALAAILLNYDVPQARRMAWESLRLRPFQPMIYASLAVSGLGLHAYRWLFAKYTRWRHGLYTGRARI
jgi:glycosyltransferase involved in cell wall biosynthesis